MQDSDIPASQAARVGKIRVRVLLAFTFAAGISDALAWLGLGHLFVANMSGNVIIIGMGLGKAQDVNLAGAATAVAAFIVGGLVHGFATRDEPAGWGRQTTWTFGLVASVLLALSIVTLIWPPDKHTNLAWVVMAVMAFAMGAQGNAANRLSVAYVNTVAVTAAIFGISSALFLAPETPQDKRTGAWREVPEPFVRAVLSVVALAMGATTGALLNHYAAFGVGLLVAAVVTGIGLTVGHLLIEERTIQS